VIATRVAVALIVGLSFVAPAATDRSLPPVHASTLQLASAEGVETFLPPRWEFRPLSQSSDERRRGIQASEAVGRIPADIRHPGLEAYWVDATGVGVSSDYYRLAARGPVQEVLRAPGCHREARVVARSPEDLFAAGQYAAATTGVCRVTGGEIRWASFVAAPGFGPVRSVGIPRSGLYVVRASVPDGPSAERRLNLLMNGVSFGGTALTDLLVAAGLPPKLP
jgi:hypothetical protein